MTAKTRKPPTADPIRSRPRAAESGSARRKERGEVLKRVPDATGPELVVFVGLDDWGCGAMAAAWFPMLADPLRARAIASGPRLPAHVQVSVDAAMREIGADLKSVQTGPLTSGLLRAADLVVTMADTFERGLLMTRAHAEIQVPVHREHWMVEPESGHTDVAARIRGLRDLIRSRVAMLVFTEGWGRADISKEMARVTRPRWHSFAPM